MSSDNASSAVTYTSISFDSNGLSWGIPFVNAGELPEIDPYEEVAQQGQTPPLLPAYVPNPMELDEHVPVYVLEPEHPEYHVPTDDDIQDPEEDHTDYPTNGEDGDDETSDDDDDTDDKDEEPTEDEEEEEEHLALTDPYAVPVVDPVPQLGIQRHLILTTSMEARIAEHAAAPIPPTSPAYNQAPLGHRAVIIRMRDDILEEDMPPQRRFILTALPPRCDVAESSAVAAARPPRAADRAEDVGYVRALQASKHRMMTSIEEVNLRVSYQAQVRRRESEDFYTQLHDARTDRRDIRLEIDIVRGQKTAYETELREVRQAYLSSEARNRALLARLETLETHMSHMEWQRQSAEDRAVKQMMRT
ncbi:hypothetical protein Tco_0974192 [Tanacetum coccineum]|uniref:Uncharacterized protein n=1 Tax=Tanacetum coccineum TaxID=301880 RepID=A0ABQ5EAW3_9ASTR